MERKELEEVIDKLAAIGVAQLGVMVGWLLAVLMEKFGNEVLYWFIIVLMIFLFFSLLAVDYNDPVKGEEQLDSLHKVMVSFEVGCGIAWLVSRKALGYEAWSFLLLMILLSLVGMFSWKAFLRLKRQKTMMSLKSIDWKTFAKIERRKIRRVADYECEECNR